AQRIKSDKEKEMEYSKGYLAALNKLKGELQHKLTQYPDNVRIQKDIDIVSSEMSKVNQSPNVVLKEDSGETKSIKLNVNDPDTFQDARLNKENEKIEEEELSKVKSSEEDVSLSEEVEYNRSAGRKL
ncbi:MAG: hypothetical protein Q4G63_12935, partial [Bacteroidia bacterium]|nr:hypothetical protein [Bacteroidia bacterium]